MPGIAFRDSNKQLLSPTAVCTVLQMPLAADHGVLSGDKALYLVSTWRMCDDAVELPSTLIFSSNAHWKKETPPCIVLIVFASHKSQKMSLQKR